MGALYKLQAKAWLSNPFNKSEFITTSLFLVVLTAIATNGMTDPMAMTMANAAIIGSITVMMIMNGALYSFGFAFFEMKESVLFKRIGATKISKWEAIGSFVLWGLTTTLITIIWVSILVFLGTVVGPDVSGILYIDPTLLAHANWGAVFSGMIVTAIAYLPIALFFVSISKNSEIYNITTTFYFFFFGFLGGAFTPNAGREWMEIIGYMSPMGWSRELVINGLMEGYTSQLQSLDGQTILILNPITNVKDEFTFVGNLGELNLFDWTSTPNTYSAIPDPSTKTINLMVVDGDWTQIGLVDLAMPIVFGTAAGLACIKTFKWD